MTKEAANDETPQKGPSDAALVVAARANEAWAKEALFRRYARMVNNLAFRLAARASDADDLVQDSFCEALDHLGELKEPAAFAGWLRTVVVRTAAKRLRRHRMLVRLRLAGPSVAELDDLVAHDTPPEVAVTLRRIYGQLHLLAPEERIAFVLRHIEGCTVPEIATSMGASEGTVKRRLSAAENVLGLNRSEL